MPRRIIIAVLETGGTPLVLDRFCDCLLLFVVGGGDEESLLSLALPLPEGTTSKKARNVSDARKQIHYTQLFGSKNTWERGAPR